MIYITGEINSQMTLDVLKRLDRNPNRTNFMLTSLGGSLADGLAIFDRVSALPNSTITASGICASAAVVVLQAAKVRRATPQTQFLFCLVHFADLDDNKAFKPHYDKVTYEIFKNRGVTDANYKWALKLKIFNAYTAKKLGLIDEIWDGVKREKPGLS